MPIDVPKIIGSTKGIQENPFIKIEMTKSNAFLVTTFGEYIDIKRKGRTTMRYKPDTAVAKKKKKILKKSQSSEESEEEDYDNEDDIEDDGKVEDHYGDEEEDKQKQKKQKTAHECYLEYLDTTTFKNSPPKRLDLLPNDSVDNLKKEKVVKPTNSPVKIEKEIHNKGEDKNMEEMEKRISETIGDKIGEMFRMFMEKHMSSVQPDTEKKEENEKEKDDLFTEI